MSASLLRAVHTPSAQVLAVWRAMPGAYLLLGRASSPLPRSGSARLAKEAGAPGIFQTFFWPLGPDQAVGYLTIIRLSNRLPISDETDIVLRGARGADRDFSLRLTPICEEEEFGRLLASVAGLSAVSLARFVLDLMRPEAEVDVRRPVLLLQSFLQHAARHEGCVELLLQIPNRILLLQGWGPPTGPNVEIIIVGSGVTRHSPQVGEFARSDIQPPLTGSVLALPVELAGDLEGVESIFLLTEDKILRRHILDNRVLDPTSSAGQLRHLLPRLVCPSTLAATLRHALQPQYEGIDTLNTSDRRVRAALDIAVAAEGVGVFLSGWLFDTADQVIQVEYCADDCTVQITADFVPIQREDVQLAFRNDPLSSTRSDFGFAVWANTAGPIPSSAYLRFTLADGDIAFIPLILRLASEPGVRAKLCSSVDMHKPSGIEIIQRHLAPFLSRATPPELTRSRVVLRGPLDRLHAVVVSLASPALPRAVIADLLRDPLTIEEQLIFVCGPKWSGPQIEALIELLQFYEVPATVLTIADRSGPLDAVLAAFAVAQADTYMIISSSAANNRAGSRQALRDAGEGADAVCPTVLYEDGSIRFAGSTELDFSERAPFTSPHSRWQGLSAEHIARCDPATAVGGTLECCLLKPAALVAAARARRFGTKFGQEAALFADLRERGSRVVWLPTIVVATADDPDSDPTVSALVDNWALRASWGETKCAS